MSTAGNDPFVPPSEADVTRLILEHPLAWVVSATAGDFRATPLPLRPVVGERGEVGALLGHFARRNPHVELLRREPRALVLFMGPHGYVSSSWLTDRTRAPTWNYVSAQYVVEIEFIDDAGATDDVMRDMVGAMESGRPEPWSMDQMGPRYARLVGGIIAFRATLVERRAKFKLGQDERDVEYAEIERALAAAGDADLLAWMQRCNAARPER
jgi:transcriptional regulator